MKPPLNFFERLFGGKPDNAHILIWTLPDKLSYWCASHEEVLTTVIKLQREQDVYFGVGLSPKKYSEHRRVKAERIAGIKCLWADIDIAHGVHQKKRLPPDEASAERVLEKIGPRPTIVVHSGHGLQAYWVLKEPWIFEDEEERKKAATFSQRWATGVRLAARDLGWEVDGVGDLSRVMRVPGTFNNKDEGEQIEVRIIAYEDTGQHDYTIEDLEQYIVGVEVEEVTDEPETAKKLRLKPGSEPPFDKMMALLENETKFRRSWDRTRKDLQDDSASGYDFSLALFAVSAGWTDQEVVDLLVAGRRRHGDPLKLREDYYERTLKKARQYTDAVDAGQELENIEGAEKTDEDTRDAKIERLRTALGVPIKRIIMYIASEPVFHLETDDRDIILGGVENLIEQKNFRNKVAAATRHVINPISKSRWQKIRQGLMDVCEEVGAGEEATLRGQVKSWLQAYLEEKPAIENFDEAVAGHRPFIKDGVINIFSRELRRWISVTQGERITGKALGVQMRAYGCTPAIVGFRQNGKSTSRGVWKLPKALFGQSDGKQ